MRTDPGPEGLPADYRPFIVLCPCGNSQGYGISDVGRDLTCPACGLSWGRLLMREPDARLAALERTQEGER